MGRRKGGTNKPKTDAAPANGHASDTDFTKAGELAAETLRGDIRDRLLTEFKGLPKPWAQMNEHEQERVIHLAQDIAGHVVNQAVHIAAHEGAPHLVAEVGQFTVKDGLKVQMNAAGTVENITRLAEHRGAAIVVLIDPSEFLGERKKAEPDVVGELAIPREQLAANEANLQKLERTLTENGPPEATFQPPDTSARPFAPHDGAQA